jgi:hypothetical protein
VSVIVGVEALLALLVLSYATGSVYAASGSQDYRGIVLGDGAGPYYRLNETGGTTAFDSSANGINGTYVSPGRVSYRQSGLLPLGTDPAVLVSGTGVVLPATTSPITETIEGWFRPTAAVDADALIVRVDDNGAWQRMLWITAGWPARNRFAYSFFIAGTQYNVVGTTTAVPNRTYYVAVSLSMAGDRSTVRLYVDGVQEATLDVRGTPINAARWQIGLEGGGALRDFVGVLDEIAFYNAILSSAQVSNHYAAGGPLPTPPPLPTSTPKPTSLVTPTALQTATAYERTALADGAGPYYRLDETGGATAFDSGATRINGTYLSPAQVTYSQPGLLPLGSDSAVLVAETGITLPATASPMTETIEGWFRPTAAVDADALIVRVDDTGAWQRMLWITAGWPEPNRFAYSFLVDSTQYNVVGTTTAVPNRTYYAAVSLSMAGNRSTVRLYVDGVQEATLDVPGRPIDADHWQIGLEGGGALRDFVGVLDEVAFYSRILSPAQVSNHYVVAQFGTSPTPTPPAICCAGDCDGDGAVTINELITLVDIALGALPSTACANAAALDCDTCHLPGIICIPPFVRNALYGCSN